MSTKIPKPGDATLNLTPDQIKDLRKRVKELADTVEVAYFDLGGELSKIARSACYIDWGYEAFDEYVKSDLEFERRKAYYLIEVHEKATALGLKADDLRGVGWSKAKELVRVCETRKDFEAWAVKARTLSLRQLIDEIKAALGIEPKEGKDAEGNTTMIGDSGEVLHNISFWLEDSAYENFKLAMDVAGQTTKASKASVNLDMIFLEFNAGNTTVTGLGEKIAGWIDRYLTEEEAGDLADKVAMLVNARLIAVEKPPETPAETE